MNENSSRDKLANTFGGQEVKVVDDGGNEVQPGYRGDALQLRGGYGFINEYDIERFYRDAKIVEIYEATKEIEKSTISKILLGKF